MSETKLFRAEDFESAKMPRKMNNGRITADCLLLDDTVRFCNARLAPLVAALERLEGASARVCAVSNTDERAMRDVVHGFMVTAQAALAEFRKLKGDS
jgi:hypothetical protein